MGPHGPPIPASSQETPANSWDLNSDSFRPRSVFVSSLTRPVSHICCKIESESTRVISWNVNPCPGPRMPLHVANGEGGTFVPSLLLWPWPCEFSLYMVCHCGIRSRFLTQEVITTNGPIWHIKWRDYYRPTGKGPVGHSSNRRYLFWECR